MSTKIEIEDIHNYLMQWYDTNDLNDFNMAMDSGYTQYAGGNKNVGNVHTVVKQ